MPIDYEMVGAQLGSAYRQTFLESGTQPEPSIVRVLAPHLAILTRLYGEECFERALYNTMLGTCYACGSTTDVGKNEQEVYVCLSCQESAGH